MNDDLEALKTSTDAALAAAADMRAWDAVRIAVLGRNGSLTGMLRDLGKTAPELRKDRGAALNRLKDALTSAIEARKTQLEDAALDARLLAEQIDPTLPPRPRETGLIHPIARTMEEIAAIFGAMGCTVVDGPDVESDWYNFGALNIPAHHPATGRPRHVLSAAEPRQQHAVGAAHPHLPRPDPHHADAGTTDPGHRHRPHLSC